MASALAFRRQLALTGACLVLAWAFQVSVAPLQVAAAIDETGGQQQQQQQQQSEAASSELLSQDQWDQEQLNPIEAALDYIGRRLPAIHLNYSFFGEHQFDNAQLDAEVAAFHRNQLPSNMSLDQLHLLAIKGSLRSAPIPIHTSWGYTNRQDLELASWPVRNERRCAAELRLLGQRLDRLLGGVEPATGAPRPLYLAQDVELLKLLDNFGRAPSDLLKGNVRWYGSYSGCREARLQLHPPGGRPTRFRYCMAAIRSASWPRPPAKLNLSLSLSESESELANNGYGVTSVDVGLQNFFFRLGTCLPEACDSASLEVGDNSRRLERLIKFNLMEPFQSDHYLLTDLYCLPDERSPLRRIPLLGKLLLLAALGWAGLVGVATLVHLNVEKFYAQQVAQMRRDQSEPANNNAPAISRRPDDGEPRESDLWGMKRTWVRLNVYLWDQSGQLVEGLEPIRCLSLYSNWLRYTHRCKVAVAELYEHERRLERIRETNRSLLESGAGKTGRHAPLSRPQPAEEGQQLRRSTGGGSSLRLLEELEELEAQETSGRRRVDTSALNAVKVIALLWIMGAHVVFYSTGSVSNSSQLMNMTRDMVSFALANGAMFITEVFFIITGCLACYLPFRANTEPALSLAGDPTKPGAEPSLKQRLVQPRYWAIVLANRYLRILPTYLLVYSFVRLVSVYALGRGQLWDYGVSPNSIRRRCLTESWLPVLTLTSNFVDIYGHCIVGGWYLSTDVQFMLLGAPLLYLLARSHAHRHAAPHAANRPETLELSAGAAKRVGVGVAGPHPRRVHLGPRTWALYGLVVGLGLLSGLLSLAYTILQSQVDMSYVLSFLPHTVAILSRNISLYTNSVFRFRAFAVGLLLGHLLYLYEQRLLRLPGWLYRHGAKLSSALILLAFCTLFAPVLYPANKIYLSHDLMALAVVLTAGAVDLFFALFVFMVCIGKAPKALLFLLNSPFWSLVSSLSLCAFLVHCEIIVLLTSQLNPPPTASYNMLLLLISATLILTYLLALALHLGFEMPLNRFIESLMARQLGGGLAKPPSYAPKRLNDDHDNDDQKQAPRNGLAD